MVALGDEVTPVWPQTLRPVRQQKSLGVTPVGERVYRGAITPAKQPAQTAVFSLVFHSYAEGTSASAIGEQGIVEPGKGSLGNDVKEVLAGYSGLHCA